MSSARSPSSSSNIQPGLADPLAIPDHAAYLATITVWCDFLGPRPSAADRAACLGKPFYAPAEQDDDGGTMRTTRRRSPNGSRNAASTALLAARASLMPSLQGRVRLCRPVEDFGYTHQHDVGRRDVEQALGEQDQDDLCRERQGRPRSERVIAELARLRARPRLHHSFGFMNPTLKVAKDFPKVKFEHATGYKRADNVATYNTASTRPLHPGVIAGRLTKSGTIGYIGSVPIPEVVMGMNAFMQGLRSVRPDGKIQDRGSTPVRPGQGRRRGEALFDQGLRPHRPAHRSAAPCSSPSSAASRVRPGQRHGEARAKPS